MTENEQKTWYFGLLTSLSGSLLIASAVQSVNATDDLRKVLWTGSYIFSGILFFRLMQKTGKIMKIPMEYIKALQIAMIIIIFAGLATIFLTTAITYEFVTMIQVAMWTLETYASIFVAVGTFLLAIFTGYLAQQTKNAVQNGIILKCRELHTVQLRNVIQGLIDTLLPITLPNQIKPSDIVSMENNVKFNMSLVSDLKNHLPQEQQDLFEKRQQYEEERKKYIEQAHGVFKKILDETANRTGLIYSEGCWKDGSFSKDFVDSLYIEAFHLAKEEQPYYVKLDYEERGCEIRLNEYNIVLVRSNDSDQRQKGKEIYTSMKNELENSEYVQEAKKLIDEQQELNLIREKILNDLNILASIPLLPGDCEFIKISLNQ